MLLLPTCERFFFSKLFKSNGHVWLSHQNMDPEIHSILPLLWCSPVCTTWQGQFWGLALARDTRVAFGVAEVLLQKQVLPAMMRVREWHLPLLQPGTACCCCHSAGEGATSATTQRKKGTGNCCFSCIRVESMSHAEVERRGKIEMLAPPIAHQRSCSMWKLISSLFLLGDTLLCSEACTTSISLLTSPLPFFYIHPSLMSYQVS